MRQHLHLAIFLLIDRDDARQDDVDRGERGRELKGRGHVDVIAVGPVDSARKVGLSSARIWRSI